MIKKETKIHKTASPPTKPKNDKPKLSVVPRVENNGLCLSFYFKTILSISNPPPFCHIKPFLHQLPLHTLLFPPYCWSLSHLSSAVPGPGQKSLHMWPGSKAAAERKFPVMPERCDSQSGCQRCSSRPWPRRQCLQRQKKERSLTNKNWCAIGSKNTDKIPVYTKSLYIQIPAKKYKILKSFFSWIGESRPKWFTKMSGVLIC